MVDLARKSWAEPRRLAPADLDPLRLLVGEGAHEYTLVLGGFHFINRVADLLGVGPELLPAPLRRFEPLRRTGVRLLARLLGRMDLASRTYAGSYAEAGETLRRVSERVLGRAPQPDALAPARSKPWTLELLRLALEERERSSLDRDTIADIHATVENSLPASADEATGLDPRPRDPVAAFAMVGTRYAQRTTAAMITALRSAGYDDLGILDLAVAIADANHWARVHRLLGLPAGILYEPRAAVARAAVLAVA